MNLLLLLNYLALSIVGLPEIVAEYSLNVWPSELVALSGDVVVQFRASSEATGTINVELRDLTDNSSLLTIPLPENQESGELVSQCSFFDHEGEFQFLMNLAANGQHLAASQVLKVTWPRVTFINEDHHVAMTTDYSATVRIESSLCGGSMEYNRYGTSLVLLHLKNATIDGGGKVLSRNAEVLQEQWLGFLSNSFQPVVYTCDVFAKAGTYQIALVSDYRQEIVSRSAIIHVDWSNDYDLHLGRIFPCRTTINLYYTSPSCRNVEDKIRVYVQKSAHSFSPSSLDYITEQRVQKEKDTVSFMCEFFSDQDPGYCFKYVSIASGGAVKEQTTLCLATSIQPDLVVDGGWAEWSQWGSCSTTCNTGVKNRYRLCENPKPSNNGLYCIGNPISSKVCEENPRCQGGRENFDPGDPGSKCNCGCTLPAGNGTIASPPAAADYCDTTANSVWIIPASQGYIVQLAFEKIFLDQFEEWIQVRNGEDESSPLVLYHTAGSQVPAPVMSSAGSGLYLELHLRKEAILARTEKLVISYYSIKLENKTAAFPPDGSSSNSDGTIMNSIVTILGIGICGIIIIISISCVVRSRAKKRRKKSEANNLSPTEGRTIDTSRTGSAVIHDGGSSTGLPRGYGGFPHIPPSLSGSSGSELRKARHPSQQAIDAANAQQVQQFAAAQEAAQQKMLQLQQQPNNVVWMNGKPYSAYQFSNLNPGNTFTENAFNAFNAIKQQTGGPHLNPAANMSPYMVEFDPQTGQPVGVPQLYGVPPSPYHLEAISPTSSGQMGNGGKPLGYRPILADRGFEVSSYASGATGTIHEEPHYKSRLSLGSDMVIRPYLYASKDKGLGEEMGSYIRSYDQGGKGSRENRSLRRNGTLPRENHSSSKHSLSRESRDGTLPREGSAKRGTLPREGTYKRQGSVGKEKESASSAENNRSSRSMHSDHSSSKRLSYTSQTSGKSSGSQSRSPSRQPHSPSRPNMPPGEVIAKRSIPAISQPAKTVDSKPEDPVNTIKTEKSDEAEISFQIEELEKLEKELAAVFTNDLSETSPKTNDKEAPNEDDTEDQPLKLNIKENEPSSAQLNGHASKTPHDESFEKATSTNGDSSRSKEASTKTSPVDNKASSPLSKSPPPVAAKPPVPPRPDRVNQKAQTKRPNSVSPPPISPKPVALSGKGEAGSKSPESDNYASVKESGNETEPLKSPEKKKAYDAYKRQQASSSSAPSQNGGTHSGRKKSPFNKLRSDPWKISFMSSSESLASKTSRRFGRSRYTAGKAAAPSDSEDACSVVSDVSTKKRQKSNKSLGQQHPAGSDASITVDEPEFDDYLPTLQGTVLSLDPAYAKNAKSTLMPIKETVYNF